MRLKHLGSWDRLDVVRECSCHGFNGRFKTGAGVRIDQVSRGVGKPKARQICLSCCCIYRVLCQLCRGSNAGTGVVRCTIRETCRTAIGKCQEEAVKYLSLAQTRQESRGKMIAGCQGRQEI